MTTQERQQRKAIAEQERVHREKQALQKELSKEEFRQKARFKALEVAQYLKPSTNYINDRSSLAPNANITKKYDIVPVAEKIYQWLIKVLK